MCNRLEVLLSTKISYVMLVLIDSLVDKHRSPITLKLQNKQHSRENHR